MSSASPTTSEFAALAYALASARGQLYAVLSGSPDLGELKRVVEGTGLANIAHALGVPEQSLSIDWQEHLTRHQLDVIGGLSQ
jgi:hypothetical protein